MQAPPIPLDETRRLQALTTLCILDTLPEERFDRITRLACRAFDVPIALVSLVDRDRQWFKSKQGLPACQTSRRISFCGHAISQEGPFVIEDACQDTRFADNPLVVGDPHIRFYAGQPIHGPDGSRIGTLCIIDRRPRTFAAEDKAMLADLAAMIDRELSLIESSTTDELTRLSNRRGLTMVGARVLALCRRNHQPAAVVGIDLDGFKAVNDGYGHDAGDDVLRLFSKLLFSHFRTSDVVARLGGDEFAILCSGTTGGQMTASLERLRTEFESSALSRAYPKLSWSAGIADFHPESEETIDDLLRASDARMYSAKAEGKRQRQR